MISERTRLVSTWEEAVTVLSKNCTMQSKNINDLEKAVLTLERRLNQKSRVAGYAFLCLGAVCFILKADRDDIHKRLACCEKELRDKQDRVHYNRV